MLKLTPSSSCRPSYRGTVTAITSESREAAPYTIRIEPGEATKPNTIFLEIGCKYIWLPRDVAKAISEALAAVFDATEVKRGEVIDGEGKVVATFDRKKGARYRIK